MTNITFIFEASPNTKPKEKKVGGHGILYPPRLKNWAGNVPRVPHQIAPMILISWVNSCNDSLFADMTLPLQKSQVHCSGVMQ